MDNYLNQNRNGIEDREISSEAPFLLKEKALKLWGLIINYPLVRPMFACLIETIAITDMKQTLSIVCCWVLHNHPK